MCVCVCVCVYIYTYIERGGHDAGLAGGTTHVMFAIYTCISISISIYLSTDIDISPISIDAYIFTHIFAYV